MPNGDIYKGSGKSPPTKKFIEGSSFFCPSCLSPNKAVIGCKYADDLPINDQGQIAWDWTRDLWVSHFVDVLDLEVSEKTSVAKKANNSRFWAVTDRKMSQFGSKR